MASASLHEWQDRMLRWTEANATKSLGQFANKDIKRRENLGWDLQRPDWEIKQLMQKQDNRYANVARAAAKLGVPLPDKIHYTTRAGDKARIAELEQALADKEEEALKLLAALDQREKDIKYLESQNAALNDDLLATRDRENKALARNDQLLRANKRSHEQIQRIKAHFERFLDRVMAETCRSCLYATDAERVWRDWRQYTRSPTQLGVQDDDAKYL